MQHDVHQLQFCVAFNDEHAGGRHCYAVLHVLDLHVLQLDVPAYHQGSRWLNNQRSIAEADLFTFEQ
jgi:hypothetical protein